MPGLVDQLGGVELQLGDAGGQGDVVAQQPGGDVLGQAAEAELQDQGLAQRAGRLEEVRHPGVLVVPALAAVAQRALGHRGDPVGQVAVPRSQGEFLRAVQQAGSGVPVGLRGYVAVHGRGVSFGSGTGCRAPANRAPV